MPRLMCLGMAALAASGAGAQRGMMVAAPPSRTVSQLTGADSLTLAAAGARAALGAPTRAQCITGLQASIRGPVGEAFVNAARAQPAPQPAAGLPASTLDLVFAGLRDGDTTTVLITLSGAGAEHMWSNDLNYYFVRDSVPGGWRLVSWQLVGARDYVVIAPATQRPRCLNASH